MCWPQRQMWKCWARLVGQVTFQGATFLSLGHQYMPQSRSSESYRLYSNGIKDKPGIKSALDLISLVPIECSFPSKGLFDYRNENQLFCSNFGDWILVFSQTEIERNNSMIKSSISTSFTNKSTRHPQRLLLKVKKEFKQKKYWLIQEKLKRLCSHSRLWAAGFRRVMLIKEGRGRNSKGERWKMILPLPPLG